MARIIEPPKPVEPIEYELRCKNNLCQCLFAFTWAEVESYDCDKSTSNIIKCPACHNGVTVPSNVKIHKRAIPTDDPRL